MIPFRILMTWVYRNSRSLFVAVLMHASYTGGQVLLEPSNVSHTDSLLWWGLVGAGLAIVAGIVIGLTTTSAPRSPHCWRVELPPERCA